MKFVVLKYYENKQKKEMFKKANLTFTRCNTENFQNRLMLHFCIFRGDKLRQILENDE
jgi:hypothetical protein